MAESALKTAKNVAQRPVLILSDGKPGHLNQSIAFVRLLDLSFEIRRVAFRSRWHKALSYLFDRLGLYTPDLFRVEGDVPECASVVSAGSETYYANRVLSREAGGRSVAIMLPKGYRYSFDLIVAQQHDRPPVRDNILSLPVNLSCPQPQGLVQRIDERPCVAFIIGGPSRHFHMDAANLERQLRHIFNLFPGADFLATTSRRTPHDVEKLIQSGPFRYRVIASKENVNPVADFLAISDYVFLTEDSTSMVSEAVCFGAANIELIPLAKRSRKNKIAHMMGALENQGCLHVFDGYYGNCHHKIDLDAMLGKVWR